MRVKRRLGLLGLPVFVTILVVYVFLTRTDTPVEPMVTSLVLPSASTQAERRVPEVLEGPQQRELVPASGLAVDAAELGTISGIVVDLLGRPVAEATCDVLADSAPIGLGGMVYRGSESQVVQASALTDQQGAFRIAVPEGFWALRVKAHGYAPWVEQHMAPGDYRLVRLRPGKPLLVRVFDEALAPMAGAQVSVMRAKHHDPRSADFFRTTDNHGEAFFDNLSYSGAWYVHVQHEEYVAAVEGLSEASGSPATIDFVMVRGIRIEGRVRVAGGVPPTGAARVQFDSDQGNSVSHSVLTDTEGAFLSERAFPFGTGVEVAALAPGFGELRKQIDLMEIPLSGRVRVDFDLDSPECFAIGEVISPDGAPVVGVEVLVKPIASLPTEITIHIPSQDAMDEDGTPNLSSNDPVERAIVRLREAGKTDSQGRFVLEGLHAQVAYKVMLVSEQYSNRVLWFPELRAGETKDFGTIRLSRGGRIWGHVRRADGVPLEGRLVHTVNLKTHHLIPNTDFKVQRPRSEMAPFDAFTNADGLFSFQPMPAGKFLLISLGKIFGPYSLAGGESLGPLELEVKDPDARDHEQTRTVEISVRDESGEPIAGSFVTLVRITPDPDDQDVLGLNSKYYMVTDGEGQIQRDIAPGLLRAVALDMTGRHARQALEVNIEFGEGQQFLDFYLAMSAHPPRVLEGMVTDAFGLPLPGMLVSLMPNTGEISCQCMQLEEVTDERGAFSFGPFLDGSHQIIVTDLNQEYSAAFFYPAVPGQSILVPMQR